VRISIERGGGVNKERTQIARWEQVVGLNLLLGLPYANVKNMSYNMNDR